MRIENNKEPAAATEVSAGQADAALDALALDLAWHDCYGKPSPPDQVIEDIWDGANCDLREFLCAAYLAVIDFRDLRMIAADTRRRR